MIYFISGHRDITEEEFKKYYVPAIYSAYHNQDFEGFVIGDYGGVDKMADKKELVEHITKLGKRCRI